MNKINSIDEIRSLCNFIRSLKRGYLTNFYLDEEKHSLWIQKGEFFSMSFINCSFLLRKTKNVNQLFYITSNDLQLLDGLKDVNPFIPHPVVIDLVGDSRIEGLIEIFKKNGFVEYETLYRMSRKGCPVCSNIKDDSVRFAVNSESVLIYDMLSENFNPLSEQIPCLEEINNFVNRHGVLVYEREHKICGFIIFELSRSTLYLRYWFVLPEFRDLKIGSKLFNEFMRLGHETKRQLFWVIANNDNAIKRYRHYGFEKENLFDYVLIRN